VRGERGGVIGRLRRKVQVWRKGCRGRGGLGWGGESWRSVRSRCVGGGAVRRGEKDVTFGRRGLGGGEKGQMLLDRGGVGWGHEVEGVEFGAESPVSGKAGVGWSQELLAAGVLMAWWTEDRSRFCQNPKTNTKKKKQHTQTKKNTKKNHSYSQPDHSPTLEN